MSAIRFASKSPRLKREVSALLEGIPFEEKADRDKVVALCLQQLVDAKRAELLFMKLFSEGLRNRSPQILLASVQAYRDEIASMIAGRDENLARTLESRSTVVTERIANRMTDGEFARLGDTGNTFSDIEAGRALAERLRELADEALIAYNTAEEAAASVQELLDENGVVSIAPAPGPKV
ncbi:hypothetical protein OIU34_22655 [Pararhizobium sp. BT-229]|uniref:hypothetical protein n=1 Tax=Pararhizobium sp. BT-229 TaxID=2986923 RepID=UPI0021F7AFB1|nr:hypothetical protein [Pararhizobium sp. BT-229]MCV9964695.1 hypothetical protein [Pararhizobium sp. BT-229]